MKKIGIVGSRRRKSAEDFKMLRKEFDRIYEKGDWIVSGGCKEGADHYAEVLAKDLGITILIHYPREEDLDEELARRNTRAAYAQINYARNTRIAEDCDVLLALVAEDRTGGTEDTVKKVVDLGKKSYLIHVNGGVILTERPMGLPI